MSNIADLFRDRTVISSPDAARAVGVSEAQARSWGRENNVGRIGVALAWTEDDVRALAGDIADDGDDERELDVEVTDLGDDEDDEDHDDEDDDDLDDVDEDE